MLLWVCLVAPPSEISLVQNPARYNFTFKYIFWLAEIMLSSSVLLIIYWQFACCCYLSNLLTCQTLSESIARHVSLVVFCCLSCLCKPLYWLLIGKLVDCFSMVFELLPSRCACSWGFHSCRGTASSHCPAKTVRLWRQNGPGLFYGVVILLIIGEEGNTSNTTPPNITKHNGTDKWLG